MKFTLTAGLIALGTSALMLAGCNSAPLRPSNPDGTYCYVVGKSTRRLLTCTTEPIPPASTEREAQRFSADSSALTVYVVRHHWADTRRVVELAVDGQVRASTIPESWVRMLLVPGTHRLSIQVKGREANTIVTGMAGEVKYVDMTVSGWVWGTQLGLTTTSAEVVRPRALGSKLIADVDVRR